MRRYFVSWMVVVLMVMLPVLAAPALAQTCSVTITNANFGPVDTLSGSARDTTANVTYNCSGGNSGDHVLICIHLGDGSGGAAADSNRQMSAGSGALAYQLYWGSDHTVVWGSSASGNPPEPIVAQLTGGQVSGQAVIYGRVFGGQSSATSGNYASSFSGYVDVRYRVTDSSDCSSTDGTPAPSPSFNVLASVEKECLVKPEPVSFGSQGVLNADVDAEGAVNVTCTPATNYRIRLNGGVAAAAPTERQMSRGGASITYGLYRNNARDQPWGDTEGTLAEGIGNGTEQQHVVYGRVPPQVTPAAGLYTDTVIVTVDYD